MKKILSFIAASVLVSGRILAQDTFSIVGIDTITGEVGSAGASCVDLIAFSITDPSFIGDIIPGKGAINTQAAYLSANQSNANIRMNAGDTPAQIISWLIANDQQGNATIRQYGIAAIVNGAPQTAAHTGTNCMNYKNHVVGKNYSIQGNILLNQAILDSMESKFKKTNGTLACKLMAAMQGAKVVGADTRCASNNSSSLFAYLKVTQPTDAYGSPYISIGVRTPTNSAIEPIDSLQKLANNINLCSIIANTGETGIQSWELGVYPNPSNGEFNIDVNYKLIGSETEVLNCLGQIIFTTTLSSYTNKINLKDLPKGIYFVRIISEKGSIINKIIKQ